MSETISIEQCLEEDSIKSASITSLRSLVGKYSLVILLDITLTFWILHSFHNLERNVSENINSSSEPMHNNALRQENVLDVWHIYGFLVFQLSFILTLVARYYAKATEFFSSFFHYCAIFSTALIIIQLIIDGIYTLFYNSEACDLVLISLTQLLFILCYVNILQCPCKYCLGVAVVHISYKNRTIHLKNHQRCNLKIIREKLKIPAEKFIIYDYPEVNYCLKTPCRTRLGFVYVNEEHSYVVKVAVVDAEESDFNEEDSLLISDYLKGTGTKTPEVARILLNHHPLMQDK